MRKLGEGMRMNSFRGGRLAEWLSMYALEPECPGPKSSSMARASVSSSINENDNSTYSQDCYEIMYLRNLEQHVACPLQVLAITW